MISYSNTNSLELLRYLTLPPDSWFESWASGGCYAAAAGHLSTPWRSYFLHKGDSSRVHALQGGTKVPLGRPHTESSVKEALLQSLATAQRILKKTQETLCGLTAAAYLSYPLYTRGRLTTRLACDRRTPEGPVTYKARPSWFSIGEGVNLSPPATLSESSIPPERLALHGECRGDDNVTPKAHDIDQLFLIVRRNWKNLGRTYVRAPRGIKNGFLQYCFLGKISTVSCV